MNILSYAVKSVSDSIYIEKEEYLKSKVRPFWQHMILRQFLRFGIYIEEYPLKLKIDGDFKNTHEYTVIYMYELKARNKLSKLIFLRSD